MIDIVIVNWNSKEQLLACLHSLAGGSVSEVTSITVVDNSQTPQISLGEANLLKYTVLQPEENLGFGGGCNLGAQQGSADFILFLNPDIRFLTNTLEKLAVFCSSDKMTANAGIFSVRLIGEDGKVQKNTARFPHYPHLFPRMVGLDRFFPRCFPPHFVRDMDYNRTQMVEQVPGAFFLIRRALFEQLNGFDERFFMYYEDVDLSIRARQAGWETLFIGDIFVLHMGGGTTESIKGRRLFYSLRSRVLYTGKHFGRGKAIGLAVAVVLVEFPARFARALLRFSWAEVKATDEAWLLFLRNFPEMVKRL